MADSVPLTTLPVHGSTRYIRTRIEVDDGLVRWEVPRTILGMIPAGSRFIEVPVAEVASVQMRRVVPHPIRILMGVGLAVAPWSLLPWWLSVPPLILGLWTILIALGPHLELVTVGGEVHRAPVCFRHSLDAELYIAALEDMISS